MKEQYRRALIAMSAWMLATLACRPVIAIGYQELALLILVAVILIGPLLFRIYRVLLRIRDEREKRD